MGDPRVCGGLNGGESGWRCLGLSGLLRVRARARACDAAGGFAWLIVCVAMRACGRPAVCRGRCVIVVVCRHLHCGGIVVSGGLSCGSVVGISFLRFSEVLTRARARLELRSGGIHVNFA